MKVKMLVDKKSWLEVKEVLNRFSSKDKSKIPDKVINLINSQTENTKDLVNIDRNKNLEQQISKEALSILTYITLQYLASSEQKEKAREFLVKNQKEEVDTYKNIDDVFNKKES